MRRALVVRHIAFEGIAGFAAPIAAAGYAIEHLDVGDDAFADADLLAPDLLVLMGGPMAVYKRDRYPWIEGELARLAARLAADLPTLGICLGAQMIAAALGADVARGPVREVGFAPIELTEAGRASPLAALDAVPLLHWHGDRFTLPDGAMLLARTAAALQAFTIGDTLALQCHPEMGDPGDGIERWCEGADAYAAGAGTTVAAIRDQHRAIGPQAADAGRRMIAAWLATLPGRSPATRL
jgi:GMP synthase (glutamine-hydrolysing)